jgi:hypothetical protein
MRDTIDMAREAGMVVVDDNYSLLPLLKAFELLVREDELERREKRHELAVSKLNAELTTVYGLLAMAHLNIKQHLEYGFNEKTAHSTLISVGRYSPRLKAEMEKT